MAAATDAPVLGHVGVVAVAGAPWVHFDQPRVHQGLQVRAQRRWRPVIEHYKLVKAQLPMVPTVQSSVGIE